MPPFVGEGMLKISCVTDRGYPEGLRGTSPPNMTPIFNEIGTLAGARISPKRLVRFRNDLYCLIARALAYNI